jgi:DNA-nicking Smr family endonuclease
MSRRPLSDAEAALWKRVIATVEPFKDKVRPSPLPPAGEAGVFGKAGHSGGGPVKSGPPIMPTPGAKAAALADPSRLREGRVSKPSPSWTLTEAPRPSVAGNLDGHWDRRMAKGGVQPDVTIDLHGHTLASAYARLDMALGQAKAADMRLMLLITGKARTPDSGRGAIRAAVSDWLASSRHAGEIAAVRNAHPRHGGDGALYIVLRRRRGL